MDGAALHKGKVGIEGIKEERGTKEGVTATPPPLSKRRRPDARCPSSPRPFRTRRSAPPQRESTARLSMEAGRGGSARKEPVGRGDFTKAPRASELNPSPLDFLQPCAR